MTKLSRREALQAGVALIASLGLYQWASRQYRPIALPEPALTRAAANEDNAATPTSEGANPIVTENLKPGATTWRVTRYTDSLEGFASATSVNRGETIRFFIDTSARQYDLYVYRSGFYGGAGGRLIKTVRGLIGQSQPGPHYDPQLGLVRCSHWAVSYELTIPTDWVSGIYIAKLVRPDTGGENYILFVVRDDQRKSAILYQQSVTTYQAYNPYGGKSLYDTHSNGCTTVTGSRRGISVSFDRPYAYSMEHPASYFYVEYPMVRWLEANGYDVTYSTNLDTHLSGLGQHNRLLDHRVFLSVGHDEYWTQPMREAITEARDQGVHLGFFSSNVAFWRVRLEADPDTGQADRIMTCYKTAEGGPADPSGHSTSTYRDPKGPNQPENALLGIQYIGDNNSGFFPLRVTAEQARHRVYRHTGLQDMPPQSYVNLGRELIGWEWDGVVDNDHTPAGLTILAASPVCGQLFAPSMDYRHNNLRTATAHSTLYTAPSGALVFAAGTNQWSWGLEEREPNPIVQQITYNLLADMGVQPDRPVDTLTLDTVVSTARSPKLASLTWHQTTQTSIVFLQINSEIASQGVTLRWNTDTPCLCQVWLGASPQAINSCPDEANRHQREKTPGQSHALWIPDLDPERVYYYQIAAVDPAGQITLSEIGQFKTASASLVNRAKATARARGRDLVCWARSNPLTRSLVD